ncbi:MAG: ribosome assembly cofactor RimP [Sphaerochaetaceae bacterium]
MEKSTLQDNPLFISYEPLLEPLGLRIVEICQIIRGSQVKLEVFITGVGKDADSGDCERAYHAIFPIAETAAGPLRDLYMEVSTPGMLRTIKDPYEFGLFVGRTVRVYDSGRRAYLQGNISAWDGDVLALSRCTIGDGKDEQDVSVALPQIQKAKLDYRWEESDNGN